MPPPVITYGDWVASWTMQTHLRVIVALSLSWLGALLALCHRVNGGAKGFSREGEPGTAAPLARLLAMGGLYGQQRPYLEVAGVTACAGVLGMVALACCDFVYARHTKARWFALHVIANVWISLLCLPDLAFMAADPLAALKEHRLNHWPASLIFSVHVYHMAFFKNLQPIDWLHHLLMVVLAGPIVITAEVGPMMNYNHFFMCGVPGGVDYLMLFLVKHSWMTPLEEKRIATVINVWFRAPWLVSVACFGYIQFFIDNTPLHIFLFRCFLLLLAAWNGLFFMERVVGNFHVNRYKAKTAADASRLSPASAAAAAGEDQDYETDEHVLPSTVIPNALSEGLGLGGGMRVAVSHQDLLQLEAEPAREAYPTAEAAKEAKKAR
uniref:TLC domain-containing protein n=1 Tax=Emiliania huxleyi TaxID=2903 RepID=A0A7S3RI03_EMIHU